jgi:chromosome segregation ATPase
VSSPLTAPYPLPVTHVPVAVDEMARSSTLDSLDAAMERIKNARNEMNAELLSWRAQVDALRAEPERLRAEAAVLRRQVDTLRKWSLDVHEAAMVTDAWAIAALARCADLERELDAKWNEADQLRAQLAVAERQNFALRAGECRKCGDACFVLIQGACEACFHNRMGGP